MQLITAEQANPVEVTLGKPFNIQLDEIPTSGYKWEFEPFGDMIQLLDDKYNIASDSAIGGGGKRSFIFQINHPGQYTLKANLVQPWIGLTSAVQQLFFIIYAK